MYAPVPVAWADFHFKQNVPRDRLQVRSVTILTGSFDGTTALSDCNKRSIFDGWGTTLQKAYPTWGTLPLCTLSPTSTPTRSPTAVPSTAVFTVGWNSMNAMPIASKYGAQSATAIDSIIFAAAAYQSPPTPNFQAYMKYACLSDTWVTVNGVPYEVRYTSSAAYGNSVFFLSSYNPTLRETLKYSSTTDLWVSLNRVPATRASGVGGAAAALMSGGTRIYVVGGSSTPGGTDSLTMSHAYTVTTDLWVTASSMPTARKALAAAATTTRLFAVGGDSPGPPYVVHGTLEMLTFATDTWLTRKLWLRTARHPLRPLA